MVDADAFNAFEAAGWEEHAGGYEAFFGPITGRLVEPLLDAASVRAGTRLLDVATGPGHVAARAAERGASVVGVDVAESMLALARRRHPGIEFRHGDAEALPLPGASFDAVVANFALLHLGRPERAAAEFARVLAPGGRLAVTVWDLPERARFIGVFLDAMAAAAPHRRPACPSARPSSASPTSGELSRLFAGAHLDDIRVTTVAFTHAAPSPAALWDGFLGGTVRTSALILGQTEPVQRAIRAAFDRGVQAYAVDAGLDLPVSVVLGSARKPTA